MTAETIDNTVVITGDVTVQEAERFPTWKKNGDYYETVDLSQATFSEYEYTCQRGTRLGHSGLTAHGRGTATKRVDTFLTLLDRLHAGTVILPSGVTRKQMNACIKSGTIGRIIVTDDSRLFSMKDGEKVEDAAARFKSEYDATMKEYFGNGAVPPGGKGVPDSAEAYKKMLSDYADSKGLGEKKNEN